jgi:DNA-binding MarR family transcriptional regulator
MPSRAAGAPAVRVPDSFESEYPTASRRATEAFLNLGLLVGGVRSAVDTLVAAEGLPSVAAFNVLSVLGGDPTPLRPSVIAERMTVTRATITGVLDSLEARRLIRRLANTDDGRSRDVSLTAAGRRIVNRLVPRMHEFERELMCVLSDRQLDQLLNMTSALQERLASLDPNAHLGIR